MGKRLERIGRVLHSVDAASYLLCGGGQRIEHSVGKLFFPQIVPQPFGGIEFRRIQRQREKVHVFGHNQFLAATRRRFVEDHTG